MKKGNWQTTEIFGIIATALAIGGVVLNNHIDIRCFYVWIISNAICAMLHFRARLWSLFARDIIFVALAVQGIILWGRNV